MANYRLYCVGDGHFVDCDMFEAVDDIAAIKRAGELRPHTATELWAGGRGPLSSLRRPIISGVGLEASGS